MVTIYEHTNYREFLNGWISSQPNGGRGLKGQMAKHLGISSTLISFILSGTKPLSMEQGSELADFVGLNEAETDYFFLLVEKERAGTVKLREKLDRRIKMAQEQARKVARRVKKDVELSDELKAIYYSSWLNTGIRNLIATPGNHDAAEISRRLNIPVTTAIKTLKFLVENGLCIEKDGKLLVGPTYTHVDSDSPFVIKHSQNWRLRGFTVMDQKKESDIFYTCPMSLSKEDAEKVRSMILKYIQEILSIMRPSPSETVRCLNIDWFEY